jgi:hypothetical protein
VGLASAAFSLEFPPVGEQDNITITVTNTKVFSRRPEKKFTISFDLIANMPEGILAELKYTVRIIRSIIRKSKDKETVLFLTVTAKHKDLSKAVINNYFEAIGEENILIDFGYICTQLVKLGGVAFAVEIKVEARGLTPEGKICSVSKLVVENFDMAALCK